MTDLDAYHVKLIKKGLRAAREGKFVSHAEMKKLIARMGLQAIALVDLDVMLAILKRR